ncbi:MAG TPA: GNAT family N-acetyltransferase, partial [Thermoplasmata archaeon]|nr:GNAT family N-acetyltransferase [Thermoplasmata archaeon]
MLGDLRREDGPQYFELMARGFPEESAVLGSRPEELQKILRRLFRWDTRLVLRLLRLFGIPLVRVLAVKEGDRLAATTLITFESKSAYISNVVADAPCRRKGYARLMLGEARRTAQRFRRRFVVLDVLET